MSVGWGDIMEWNGRRGWVGEKIEFFSEDGWIVIVACEFGEST